jgi:hypothetical protein
MTRGLPITMADPLSDQDRDVWIDHCGNELRREYEGGNREAAEHWQELMFIALRDKRDARTTEPPQDECYFEFCGTRDRLATGATK